MVTYTIGQLSLLSLFIVFVGMGSIPEGFANNEHDVTISYEPTVIYEGQSVTFTCHAEGPFFQFSIGGDLTPLEKKGINTFTTSDLEVGPLDVFCYGGHGPGNIYTEGHQSTNTLNIEILPTEPEYSIQITHSTPLHTNIPITINATAYSNSTALEYTNLEVMNCIITSPDTFETTLILGENISYTTTENTAGNITVFCTLLDVGGMELASLEDSLNITAPDLSLLISTTGPLWLEHETLVTVEAFDQKGPLDYGDAYEAYCVLTDFPTGPPNGVLHYSDFNFTASWDTVIEASLDCTLEQIYSPWEEMDKTTVPFNITNPFEIDFIYEEEVILGNQTIVTVNTLYNGTAFENQTDHVTNCQVSMGNELTNLMPPYDSILLTPIESGLIIVDCWISSIFDGDNLAYDSITIEVIESAPPTYYSIDILHSTPLYTDSIITITATAYLESDQYTMNFSNNDEISCVAFSLNFLEFSNVNPWEHTLSSPTPGDVTLSCTLYNDVETLATETIVLTFEEPPSEPDYAIQITNLNDLIAGQTIEFSVEATIDLVSLNLGDDYKIKCVWSDDFQGKITLRSENFSFPWIAPSATVLYVTCELIDTTDTSVYNLGHSFQITDGETPEPIFEITLHYPTPIYVPQTSQLSADVKYDDMDFEYDTGHKLNCQIVNQETGIPVITQELPIDFTFNFMPYNDDAIYFGCYMVDENGLAVDDTTTWIEFEPILLPTDPRYNIEMSHTGIVDYAEIVNVTADAYKNRMMDFEDDENIYCFWDGQDAGTESSSQSIVFPVEIINETTSIICVLYGEFGKTVLTYSTYEMHVGENSGYSIEMTSQGNMYVGQPITINANSLLNGEALVYGDEFELKCVVLFKGVFTDLPSISSDLVYDFTPEQPGGLALICSLFDSENVMVTSNVHRILIKAAQANWDSEKKKGNGGCSDCTPPTLGKDKLGHLLVSDGITINGHSEDGGYYHTVYPMQYTTLGQENKIILKYYENSGPQNIKVVQLGIGIKEIGTSISESQALIETHMGYFADDIENPYVKEVKVIDPHKILSNTDATASLVACTDESAVNKFAGKVSGNFTHDQRDEFYSHLIDDTCLQIDFTYTYLKVPDSEVLGSNAWDYNRNTINNYFNEGLMVTDPTPQVILEEEIKEAPICKGTNVPHRNHCAFGLLKDFEEQRALDYLNEMYNKLY